MRRRIIGRLFALIAITVLAACVLAACTNPSSASTSSPSASSSSSSNSMSSGNSSSGSFSPVSIVEFEGVKNADKLVADMEAGAMPVSSTVRYDQMGALPTVTVTDSETIAEIYNNLKGITVAGPSDESITDCYHYIGFELQDGTEVGFNFEGEGLLSLGRENYRLNGGGALWKLVRQLQDDYMEANGTSAS